MKHLLSLAMVAMLSIFSANAQNVSEDLLMYNINNGNAKRLVIMPGKLSEYDANNSDLRHVWTCFDTNGKLLCDAIWKVFVYDNNGRYVRGQVQEAKIERNERGQITNMTSGDLGIQDAYYDDNYTYNQYGNIETESYSRGYSSGLITYIYNDKHELISSRNEYEAEGNEGEVEAKYVITRRDQYGNWTERKVIQKETEKEDGKVTNTSEEEFEECRIIEYYKPGEKSMNSENFIMPVRVNGTNVRLRLGPSTKHQIFTIGGKTVYPPKDALLKYVGETEDFFRVEYKGAEVYISKQFAERDMESVQLK